jgi:23S rRNA pseudouridine2605 synthase
VRLNRFLAAAGVASRRGADQLIAAGRVTVNGRTCTDFHFQPLSGDHVKVDGRLIRPDERVYLMLHKPAGFVCSRPDGKVSDTIYDLLPAKFSSLFYVGRLDVQSEGLLLLTNDGGFAQQLTHPRFKTEKEYEVVLDKPAARELKQQLLLGTLLDGKHARVVRVHQLSPVRLRIVLEQGINRQIRRMLERFGYETKRLRRVRIGNLRLEDLSRGRWRVLGQREVRLLRPCQLEVSQEISRHSRFQSSEGLLRSPAEGAPYRLNDKAG